MKRVALLCLTLLLVAAACGDDDTTATTAGTVPPDGATTAAPAPSTTQAPPVTAPAGSGPSLDAEPAEMCAELFSIAEVEALFEEPAAFDEDMGNGFDPSLGQILCSWTTVEDPDDMDDLAFETLVVQVYVGDPIAGANFFGNPEEIYEDVRHLEGIGDDAFVAGSLGLDTGFVDGDLAGFLSYTAFNIDDEDFGAGEERVIEYLRMLHERLT